MKYLSISTILFLMLSTTACDNTVKETAAASADSTVTYRPLFHFTTDSNWINDPNGLVYANGKFHLFAQYNPFGNRWGHMSWAHATSTDLFNWQQLPVAIQEDIHADSTATMIFSGCAVVDSFNTSGFAEKQGQVPLVAIYTSHVDNKGTGIAQHQSLAYSLDEGVTWTKYRNNPVLDIKAKDFRDPQVFWYAPKKAWIMIVCKPDEYKVYFYSSSNLKDWKKLSEFGGIGNTSKIWECPDLFELPVEGTGEKKWVITLSAGHPQKDFLAMQYFTGSFDGEKFIADQVNYPLYLDYGKDYYAGITYKDIPAADGRKIMIGWANCWNYANDIPTKGFRGLYGVPRVLSLRKTAEGIRLVQQPVKEIEKHEELLYAVAGVEVENGVKVLDSAKGTSLDISFTLQPGTGGTAGIKVFKSGDEETAVYYNSATQTVAIDRTKSGDTSFSKVFASVDTVKVNAGDGKVKFRLLIDKSVVELFVNDGVYVLTDLVFPKQQDGGVELFSENGKAVFTDVQVKKVAKTIH
ncbi:glycoside hydrolase family 32 protein [Foetidibacter luteolus]|uniref:glycoside hydrolase family 32 protein n=1 Tax=Foetidibacter luteolus TaxID=2608880 RepID=UPI00129B10CC|nr:glycoside hydrolase family 32 protein [Foetidibacter luteolus]